MNVFWKSIIEPILEMVRPTIIAEVGCHQGDNTRNLAGFCETHHCDLHVIDPAPDLDPAEVARWHAQPEFGFALHKAPSLDVLPRLSRVDAVFLDGDHNWHTVVNELRALERAAMAGVGKLPIVFLHDVGWPYGRRDMYYAPGRIPENQRQEFGPGGAHPKFNGLTGEQGLNVGANHALREGGPRNGVLTAVEDYLRETEVEFSFTVVPVFHGLGILCPTSLLGWNDKLAAFLKSLDGPLFRGGLLDAVEQDRLRHCIDAGDLRRCMKPGLDALGEEDLTPAMEKSIQTLFGSLRWRIGDFLVNTMRKLLLRPKEVERIQNTLEQIVTTAKLNRDRRIEQRKHARPTIETADASLPPGMSVKTPAGITREFHRLYYGNEEQTWRQTYWLGTTVLKCPLDLWQYQEILHQTRPDLIIETGTYQGGSALFLASVCDQLGCGEVLTIDLLPRADRPEHPRVTYLAGSSVDPAILRQVEARVREAKSVMVILDSDHSHRHVLAELRAYAPFVTRDGYLIVEDTNVNGHPVLESHGPGPREAVEEFLAGCYDFAVDPAKEKFLLTFNPGGYLRRLTDRPALRSTGRATRQLVG